MSIMRYREDFVKRTVEILEEGFPDFILKDREVTFLLNCLLGLIVTVAEIEKTKQHKVLDEKIDDEFLALIPTTIGFVKNKKDAMDEKSDLIKNAVTKLHTQVSGWDDLKNKKKSWLIKNIRNGISHLNIEWKNDNEQIKAIKLWNKPFGKEYAKRKDFEIIFEIEQLRKFATEISQKYLSEKNPQQAEQLATLT